MVKDHAEAARPSCGGGKYLRIWISRIGATAAGQCLYPGHFPTIQYAAPRIISGLAFGPEDLADVCTA